uniref:Uncharacterized protein n=1 Tax=Cucumis melo TaxID=3656 RepID=A0A9I9E796_CUCME
MGLLIELTRGYAFLDSFIKLLQMDLPKSSESYSLLLACRGKGTECPIFPSAYSLWLSNIDGNLSYSPTFIRTSEMSVVVSYTRQLK